MEKVEQTGFTDRLDDECRRKGGDVVGTLRLCPEQLGE